MIVNYQPELVLLSIGVAILGSLTALALTSTTDDRFGRRADPAALVRRHNSHKGTASADFFLQLFRGDKSAKRYARLLAELQEALGNYNDMTMAGHLKTAFEAAALPAASSQAFGAVLGWQARGLTSSEAGLKAAWRSVAEISPSWLKAPDRG